MLSVALERPVDPETLEVLRQVDRAVRDLALECFVVGAMARGILLHGVFGLDAGRETRDVDLGIVLKAWPQFEAFKARLVGTGMFLPDEKITHRLHHRADPTQIGYPLDLIPFGGVERHAHEIAWPPDGSVVMNVAGYDEALAAAVPIEVESGFVVRVASLPGLAILKLIAWADRGIEDSRDARDLATLLRQYGAAGNEDRLYGPGIGVLEAVGNGRGIARPVQVRISGDLARLHCRGPPFRPNLAPPARCAPRGARVAWWRDGRHTYQSRGRLNRTPPGT